jgi:effector-binding domain-containing protein
MIEHKHYPDTLVVMRRFTVQNRAEIRVALRELAATIPDGLISGPAFCIFWFVTSVQDGFDVEVGYPIDEPFENQYLKSQLYPAIEVLSMIHKGPIDALRERYGQLYAYAAEHALISDEFRREIYLDADNPEGEKVDIQFVIHNWNALLAENVARVLGKEAAETVMQNSQGLGIEASVEERFLWTKSAIQRLGDLTNADQKYEIMSRCAHVFPQAQVDKLRVVFEDTLKKTQDGLVAVDAVIEFMDKDPGWGSRPRREGRTIYSTKSPRDPEGYQNAKDPLDKRRAYCFCPLVRDHLDQGMSPTFCNCSTGWNRRQWEGAIGKAVKIDIVQSILRGDEVCEFAIHLPENL